MEQQLFATKDDFWRLQEAVTELSATQAQHSDRIMRLEKRGDDNMRGRNAWGPSSPFPSVLGSSHHGKDWPLVELHIPLTFNTDSSLNPAAEAFRNFDADPTSGLITSLSLDNTDDPRRAAAASRANSVRFDESANNHYGSSRQSIDLPTRTGSGLGSHPLSERSLSHRSDGRASTSGFGRTNSFGLEQSRLLGSIHNSPRVSAHPPPGFFVLGPCPSIIRCWLTETFSNDSLLYAAVCTGSTVSSVSLPLIQHLGLDDSIIEENGLRKVKLAVYLTEAKVQYPSSRSASPAPQVPTLLAKFLVHDVLPHDKSIQIIIGSDILRSHNADVLFSQDKLVIFDEERNQLSIPLVRPEDDSVYKYLGTNSRVRNPIFDSESMPPPPPPISEQGIPGIIGRPGRIPSHGVPESPTNLPSAVSSSATSEPGADSNRRTSLEYSQSRANEDSRSTTGSEKSFTAPVSKTNTGVWSNSWRSGSATVQPDASKTVSSYAKPNAPRPMKVLRPGKAMNSTSRTTSTTTTGTNGIENFPLRPGDTDRKPPQLGMGDAKQSSTGTPRSNPIGTGSAFGWLNSSQQRKSSANGS